MTSTEYDPRPSRDHLGMMKRPDLWPVTGRLPLVKRSTQEFGVLVWFYGTYMWMPGALLGRPESATTEPQRIDEAGLVALVDDGWTVD